MIEEKIHRKKSTVVCSDKECQREIADVKSLVPYLEQDCFRIMRSFSRPSVKLDQNMNVVNKDIAKMMAEVQEFGFKIDGIFLCYSGHYIGFKIEGQESNVCIHRDSRLSIKYQDLQIKEYANFEMDFEDISNDDRLSELKKNAQVKQFSCMVCKPGVPFESETDISHHLFENKTHRTKLDNFKENL